MIEGHVTATVNARSEPVANTSSTGNVVRQLLNGQTFKGSIFRKDSLGRDWIKLVEINNVPVSTEMYIAAFISTVKVDRIVPDVPDTIPDDLMPLTVTTIEQFILPDGTRKERKIIWSNPQVAGE